MVFIPTTPLADTLSLESLVASGVRVSVPSPESEQLFEVGPYEVKPKRS